jgi:hypothetical protein
MWQRITNPDVLVYLQASFEVCTQRRQLNWNVADYDEQTRRLAHARQHADILIETDGLSPAQVLERVLALLADMRKE